MKEAYKYLAIFAERIENSFFWVRDSSLKKQLYLSPSFESVWGISRESVYNDPLAWTLYVHPDDLSQHNAQSMLKAHAQKGVDTKFSAVYRVYHPTKGLRWIKDTSFPLYQDDHCVAFAGIAEDITQVKQYELELIKQRNLAQTANKAKSEFIANMGHDIRTAITGMLGIIEEWRSRAITPQDLEDAILLEGCTSELLTLANEILHLILIDSSQEQEESVYFDIRGIIQHNIGLLLPAAKQKNICLYAEIADSVHMTYFANKILIDRIVLNLLSNAIKFTDKGHVLISLRCLTIVENRAMLQLVVEDTGIGIATDKLEVIFEKFTRLSPSCQGVYKGSGLGLHKVKCFLDMLGGSIDVKSELGVGSQFTVTLPLTIADREKSGANGKMHKRNGIATSLSGAFCNTNTVQVLVIDSNVLSLHCAERLLRQLHYYCCVAATLQEALQHISRHKVAVIMVDVVCWQEFGDELLSNVHGLYDSEKNIPVFIGLAADYKSKAAITSLVPFSEIVSKPLRKKMITKLFVRWLPDLHIDYDTVSGSTTI